MTAQNEYYYSRVCFVIFPVGDDPFDVILGVIGSDDRSLVNPSVFIPVYSKSDLISVVRYFFKFPDAPL